MRLVIVFMKLGRVTVGDIAEISDLLKDLVDGI